MKFLERNKNSKSINFRKIDLNGNDLLKQEQQFKNPIERSNEIMKGPPMISDDLQKDKTQNRKSQIPAFIRVMLKYFESIKSNLNYSLDSLIKVLVDRIFNETQVVRKSYTEKEQNEWISIKQLQRITQTVEILNQELNKMKQIFSNKEQQIFFPNQISTLKTGQNQLQKHPSSKKTIKLEHAISYPPRLFYPQNQHDHHNQQSHIQYEYQLLNEQQQSALKNQQYKIRISQQTKNPQQQNVNQKLQQEQKVLTLEQYQNQKTNSSLNIQSNKCFNFQYLNVTNKNKRKNSFNLENNNKIYGEKQTKSNFSSKKQRFGSQMSEQTQKALSIEVKSPMQQLQQLYRHDRRRINLKNHKIKLQVKQEHQSFQDISANYNIQKSSDQLKNKIQWKNDISLNVLKNDKSLLKNNEIRPQRFRKFSHYENTQSNNQSIGHKNSNFLTSKQNNLKTLNSKLHDLETKSAACVKNNPILTLNQLRSAAIYLNSQNFTQKDKIQNLEKSLSYDPKNLSAAQSLSFFYLKHQNYRGCLTLCNSILDNFIDENGRIKQKNHSNLIHIICNKSASLNFLGRYSQTVKFIQNLKIVDKNSKLTKNLADAYSSLGKFDIAIQYYKQCLEIEQKNDEIYYNLAACYFMSNCYSDSIHWALQAIRINPHQPQYLQLYQNIKTNFK